jgi:hypothetical protein
MKTLALTTLLALLVVIPFVGKKNREIRFEHAVSDGDGYQTDPNRLYDIEDLIT